MDPTKAYPYTPFSYMRHLLRHYFSLRNFLTMFCLTHNYILALPGLRCTVNPTTQDSYGCGGVEKAISLLTLIVEACIVNIMKTHNSSGSSSRLAPGTLGAAGLV